MNVSELGLVTQTGKVVWSKYAQVTNNPELDGCINSMLLVWTILINPSLLIKDVKYWVLFVLLLIMYLW